MKKFFESLLSWIDAMGRARAAAELSRQGRYEEAKRLVSGN